MNPLYPSVADQAGYKCEYCLAPQSVFNMELEVDHVEAESKGGETSVENSALSCRSCNSHKSNRDSAVDEVTANRCPFFNPRTQDWDEHFYFNPTTDEIEGKSCSGRVTVKEFWMNGTTQLNARRTWIECGLFPTHQSIPT